MASTLVHMSCAQLTNAMIIGMDSDSVEESLPGDERGKRDHDLDENEQSQVKKRRKQSKPMRITSSEGNVKTSSSLQGNFDEEHININEQVSEVIFESINECSSKYSTDTNSTGVPRNDYCIDVQPNNMLETRKEIKSESFPLNLSTAKSLCHNSVESLPVASTDEKLWYKGQENTAPYQVSVSEPLQLKNEFYQNNILLPSQPSQLMLNNFKNIVIGNNEQQIPSPHRIFNPEAFCDLCNKEFCNKYFLKTHRANKHGIYNETLCSNLMDNLSSLPIVNYFSNNYNSITVTNSQSNKKNTTSAPNTNSKPSNGSLRAFCNICQREFCNKYFVRRHKAKIHGIVESHAEESQEFKSQSYFNLKSDVVNDVNLPGPSSTKIVKDSINGASEEPIPKVKKEHDNESEGNTSPQTALNLLVSTWQNEENKDASLSPNRLKKIGVVNNNAFCDICCKEYCNKYFLRIHKQKCHGIMISEKYEKVSGNGNCWKPNQSVPLNLILREANKEPAESSELSVCGAYNGNISNNPFMKLHYDQVHSERKSTFSYDVTSGIEQINKNMLDVQKIKSANDAPDIIPNLITEPERGPAQEIAKMNPSAVKMNPTGIQESSICEVCSKDLGKADLLESHILKEHSFLLDDISNNPNDDNANFQALNPNSNIYSCSKCQKLFSTFSLLEQHLNEQHQSDGKLQTRNGVENSELPGQLTFSGERQNVTTPTSSFCDICKKELCNKYFMKTHMQRMHGISIENGTHIGGVVCDICNKELCSKYFLRVHKQNSHGIVEEAFLPQISSDVKAQNATSNQSVKLSENQLSHRYFSHFTEVCLICSRRFRSTKWLKAHLQNDHGEEGKEKLKDVHSGNRHFERLLPDETRKTEISSVYSGILKNTPSDLELTEVGPSTSENQKNEQNVSTEKANEMLTNLLSKSSTKQYQCSYCHFSSPVLALLLVHERTHATSLSDVKYRCPLCMTNFETNENLEKHILSHQTQNHFSYEQDLETTIKYKENAQFINVNYNKDDSEKMSTIDDNNLGDVHVPKYSTHSLGKTELKCFKCSYTSHHLDLYTEHVRSEHKFDEKSIGSLQILRDALLQIANTTLIPASFAIPNNYGSFMMQPFVLEDKAPGTNTSTSFLSSLVFLPVKERLNKPVTASFKLTPT